MLKQVFEDGFFHGDLHPRTPVDSGRQQDWLIDFGLVGRRPAMRADGRPPFHVTTRNNEGVARARGNKRSSGEHKLQ